MALVPLTDMLAAARRGGYAVGYFEAWDSYSLEAVLEAAEAERAPTVLGFGCAMVDRDWLDTGGTEILAALGRQVAERASVPVSLLFNETHTVEQARRGVLSGFNAAMLDTCALPAGQAREVVAEFTSWAHGRGAAVEAELGQLPNASGDEVDSEGASVTVPAEAAEFVAATGVDCLAVSVGNVHLLEGRRAQLDLGRLAELSRAARVPLVLHGGTGLAPEAVPSAIALGVAKINVGTALKRAFLEGAREAIASDASPHDLLGSHKAADIGSAGKARMVATVRRLIQLYGAQGRALG